MHGIDASETMVGKLRGKPGAERIQVRVGDFRDFSFEERFRLVYVVFNTFFGLQTQEDQITCLRAVARHLTDDGVFVIEAFVPDPSRFDRGQRVSAIEVNTDEVRLEVTKHDPVAQQTVSQHVMIREDGVRLIPVRIRYAHVAELDLMARVAGLRLRERWAGWDREPFSISSQNHVSVYEPAAST